MKKQIIVAALFSALTAGVAEAQYWGRPMGGGYGRNPYADAQNWGFRMGDNAKMHGLATDCTDYGQGDCAERMARMGRHPGWAITGGGGGYGSNYGGQGYGGGWGGGGSQFHYQQRWGGYQYQSSPRLVGWRVCNPYGRCWFEPAR